MGLGVILGVNSVYQHLGMLKWPRFLGGRISMHYEGGDFSPSHLEYSLALRQRCASGGNFFSFSGLYSVIRESQTANSTVNSHSSCGLMAQNSTRLYGRYTVRKMPEYIMCAIQAHRARAFGSVGAKGFMRLLLGRIWDGNMVFSPEAFLESHFPENKNQRCTNILPTSSSISLNFGRKTTPKSTKNTMEMIPQKKLVHSSAAKTNNEMDHQWKPHWGVFQSMRTCL
jgi:hypothetical protein